MRSKSSIIISLIITAVIFGSVGGMLFLTNQYEPSRVSVVVMTPGFGDRSMADTILEGLEMLQGDISVQYFYPEYPSTRQEAEDMLKAQAATGVYELIIALGQDMTEPVKNAAVAYPGQRFAIIGGQVNEPNVVSARFDSEEAAYLAGVLAAFLVTSPDYTGIIATLASYEDDPAVEKMVLGFNQGVTEASSTYDLNVTMLEPIYLNSYNDTENAAILTESLFTTHNASLIFAPVRASIMGVREGMFAANQTIFHEGRMPYVIAAEGNQDYLGNRDYEVASGPSWIPTSVVPRADLAVYEILNKTLWNEFPAGQVFNYNLANGGVNVTDFRYSSTYINTIDHPAIEGRILDIVRQYRLDIIAGDIIVGL